MAAFRQSSVEVMSILPECMFRTAPSKPSQQVETVMAGPVVSSAPMFNSMSQWMASSPAAMVRFPLSTLSRCSALMASFTSASMFSVSSRMVRLASRSSSAVPDLMPFLPSAFTVSAPPPQRTTCEPSLHLTTAFSAFSLSVALSGSLASLSVRVFSVPSTTAMVTPVDSPQTMGAVSALVRVRPSSSSTTSSVWASTFTEPSAQLPDRA